MMTLEEQKLLEEIYRGSQNIQKDIHTVLGKVWDDELALDLNGQAAGYARMKERAEDHLLSSGMMPDNTGMLEKTRRWAELQLSTALNVSTGHIASLIRDAEKESLGKMEELLKDTSVFHSKVYELAEEFREFEKKNLRILNSYELC